MYTMYIYICVCVVNPDCSSSFERIWRANEWAGWANPFVQTKDAQAKQEVASAQQEVIPCRDQHLQAIEAK